MLLSQMCMYRKKIEYIENDAICVFRCLLRILELLYSSIFYVKFLDIAFWCLCVYMYVNMCVCLFAKCVNDHRPYLFSVNEATSLQTSYLSQNLTFSTSND